MFHQSRETERPTTPVSATDWLACLGWMALGAGIMYVLDPIGGARRRGLVRDKFVRGYHEASDAARGAVIQARNRTTGFAHEARARLTEGRVDDDTLAERVRSQMGRAVTHPGAIIVKAHDGEVALSGPILTGEVNNLLSTVHSVRGVQCVRNELDVHETPGEVPALQGQGSRQSQG